MAQMDKANEVKHRRTASAARRTNVVNAKKVRLKRMDRFYERRQSVIAKAKLNNTLHKIPLTIKEAASLLGITESGVRYRGLGDIWRRQRNAVGHQEYFIPLVEFSKRPRQRKATSGAPSVRPVFIVAPPAPTPTPDSPEPMAPPWGGLLARSLDLLGFKRRSRP